MFSLVCWLAFGAVVGGIAKWFMPGRIAEGWLPAIALGMAGSFVGGVFFGGHPAGWLGSVVAAVVLIWLYEQFGASNETH
jgi:uncharacterized membrane protein YeaQ/YmgE (transglycosylase-associated protein family)